MVPERGPARANPARGLALIATAVILGIFVLRQGWDDAGSVGADDASGQPPASESSGGGSTTTPPTQPPRQPAEVTVRVANASGVQGAAGRLTDTIEGAGYITVEATDGQSNDPAKTTVLYTQGFESDAATLASSIGTQPTSIAPLANPPQIDPAGAQLVVLLGSDLAE